MDRKVAKELLHIRDWLDRAHEIVERGKDAYLADELLQEAGDSLMMRLGDLTAWRDALAQAFATAEAFLRAEADGD